MAAIDGRHIGVHSGASRGSQLRQTFVAMLTTATGIALLSCSAAQPSAVNSSINSTAYEPLAPIARTPLPAPAGYVSASAPPNSTSPDVFPSEAAGAEAASFGKWRESPRWAAIKGDGCIVVDQESAAQTGTAKFRVDNCKGAGELP
jgi:hypothetical protein